MVAAKLAQLSPGNPTGSNQYERKAANLPLSSLTQKQAAELLNVGERSVATAAKGDGGRGVGEPEARTAI
jgi:hypothetical protein